MIHFHQRGSFGNTERYLSRLQKAELFAILNKYGSLGVNALSNATPVDSGATAASWSYTIHQSTGRNTIVWRNSNQNDGLPIAILLQYGHGTGTGGYVQGRDYVNPAIRPIFEQMASDAWKEVTRI